MESGGAQLQFDNLRQLQRERLSGRNLSTTVAGHDDGFTDARYTTSNTQLVRPLASNRNGQNYKIIVRAYDDVGNVIGKVWVRYGILWHDGASFRVGQ